MPNELKGATVQINQQEYNEFSNFLRLVCGINLGENKQYLVSTRIRKILLENNLSSLNELTRRIQRDTEKNAASASDRCDDN